MTIRVTSRRELLKLGASAVLAAGAGRLLAGCSGGSAPTVQHPDLCTGATPAGPATVHAVRGRDLAQMTRDLLGSLGGIGAVVNPGDRVFIKPNMVELPWATTHDVFRAGECTKPEILVALADACLAAGAASIIIGDASQMPTFDWSRAIYLDGSTDLVAEAARLATTYGKPVQLACLDRDSPEWIEVPTALSFGHVKVSSLVMNADKVISVPVAKTHAGAYFTLSIKNFIGTIPLAPYGWVPSGTYARDAIHANDREPQKFNRLPQDICKAVQPDLAIIDMSIGMEANGPSQDHGGVAVDVRHRIGDWLLLGSTDLVAADATAARVMGQDEWKIQEAFASARDAGLGAMCSDDIQLVGANMQDIQMHWTPAQVG
jgi:uncharacterized protein (DUF362 family)